MKGGKGQETAHSLSHSARFLGMSVRSLHSLTSYHLNLAPHSASVPLTRPSFRRALRHSLRSFGVSDGVVALGGMEWRECEEHERDKPQG